MDYRLIVFSSSGETAKIEDWNCASDMEAIDRAAEYVSSFGRELWQGDRHISTFAGPLSGALRDSPSQPGAQAL